MGFYCSGAAIRHCLSQKTLGQLFCDDSAKDIVDMLQQECDKAGVSIALQQDIQNVSFADGVYTVTTPQFSRSCQSLVVACGGLSLPNLGATAYGFQLAEQFGLNVLPVRAALVPLTWQPADKAVFEEISGVSLPVTAQANDVVFPERYAVYPQRLKWPCYFTNLQLLATGLTS